jgi:hypothetical protein
MIDIKKFSIETLDILIECRSVIPDMKSINVNFDDDTYLITIECICGNIFEIKSCPRQIMLCEERSSSGVKHYVGRGMGYCYQIYLVCQETTKTLPGRPDCLAMGYRPTDRIPIKTTHNSGLIFVNGMIVLNEFNSRGTVPHRV